MVRDSARHTTLLPSIRALYDSPDTNIPDTRCSLTGESFMANHVVTIFGSSQPQPGSAEYDLAFELGKTVAEAGWTVCNGGYGGTMEASAHGAASAGGHTIGVTCRAFGPRRPNAHVRQEVPTFDLLGRLNTLVRLGRAYVVLPGGTGTLLELALVWESMNKSLLRSRTVVLLGGFWMPVVACVREAHPDTCEVRVAREVPIAIAILREHFSRSPT